MAPTTPPPTATTVTISAPSFTTPLFFPNTPQISSLAKRIPKKLSCKSNSSNDRAENHQPMPDPQRKLARRDVVFGLGGLYGAASLADNSFAFANPVSPSDCGDAHSDHQILKCCPPPPPIIHDFKPLRIRQPANAITPEYWAKYKRAVEAMKALPEDDPRSFMQQANVHCAYCDDAYQDANSPGHKIQVHKSWLFFPFHRWYLYFYEKILGKLIDDPSFALPFWNWDAPDGMKIPDIFKEEGSPLYDSYRNVHHVSKLVELNCKNPKKYQHHSQEGTEENNCIVHNLNIMNRQMMNNNKPRQFFGADPYNQKECAAGSIENVPHNCVHDWCGDPDHNNEDMGMLFSAGRDPIFFAHHANVDRMWSIWKTLPGGTRVDYTDEDWLNSEFLFYDENAKLVRVKVRDCLDIHNLGYDYQKVPIPWKDPQFKFMPSTPEETVLPEPITKDTFPLTLESNISVEVPMRPRGEGDDEEELLIQGIQLMKGDKAVKFDVFVNNIDAEKWLFAGSFVHVPHGHTNIKTNLRIGITELLEDLQVKNNPTLVVTLVPRFGETVQIGGITIEFA